MSILHFNKKDPLAREILWVAKSRSRDKNRKILGLILIEKNPLSGLTRIVATDGRRLHMSETDKDLAPGLYEYEPGTNNVFLLPPVGEVSGKPYPNYAQLLPAPTEGEFSRAFTVSGSDEYNSVFSQIYKTPGEGFNPDLVKDALSGDVSGRWELRQTAPADPLRVFHGNRTVLLIPLNCHNVCR